MLRISDFMELEKLAEAMAEAEKAVGVAIEQNCSDEFWKKTLAEKVKIRHDFYVKLYAMRSEIINEL